MQVEAMTVPVAPASTDNNTVILWAVAVLIIVLGLIAKALWSKMNANEENLRAAMKDAYEKHDAAQKRIEALQGGVIMDQQKTQLLTNNVLEKTAVANEKLAESIDALRDSKRK
jgi:hypothetical protein